MEEFALGDLLQFIHNGMIRLKNTPEKDACRTCPFRKDCPYPEDGGEALCCAIPEKLAREGLTVMEIR